MFRELRRKNKAIPMENCIELLTKEPRGVLSVQGDDGYPYGIPINFWYCPEDGHIYFHGSKLGHKIDSIKRCDKVSFCVYDAGYREEGEWALNIQSVIVFGRIRKVEDYDCAMEVARNLARKFTDDSAYIENEIATYGKGVQCLELIPEHMTGKKIKES